LQIRALGAFDVQIDGAPLPLGRKAPKRLLELLKALVALGGREVPLHRLADAMFPDQDADVAEDSLRVSLQRLRKLLGSDAFVVLREGRVSLAERLVWVDVIAFQQALVEDASDDVVAAALMLHAGPLLDGDESPWVIAPREKLRSLFLRQALRLAERHAAGLRWDAALDWYGRCADADPLNESFVQGGLRCCAALGRVAEGETAYRRLETALAHTLGRAPADRTRRALQALLGGDRGDR
jgi:DNA-binding SARP family transcriptional activator